MGGFRAHHSEIIDGGNNPLAKNVMPQPVYNDARGKWVGRFGDAAGPFDASTAGRLEGGSVKRIEKAAGVGFAAEILMAAADVDRFVLGIAIGHAADVDRRRNLFPMGSELGEGGSELR